MGTTLQQPPTSERHENSADGPLMPSDVGTTKPIPIPIAKVRSRSKRIWFDVPFMLVMLILGASVLSGDNNVEGGLLGWRAALLLFYTFAIVLNIIHGITQVNALDAPFWKGRTLLGITNVAFDLLFALGLVLLHAQDETIMLAMVLALASTRLLEQIAMRPASFVVLSAALAGALFDIYRSLDTSVPALPAMQHIEILITIAIFLILGYVVRQRALVHDGKLSRILDRARMHADFNAEAMPRQILRNTLLQGSIKAINSAVELDDVLMMIVNNAVRVLKGEQSTIGLIDEESGDLVVRCATGINSTQLTGRHFLPGVGVAGWVIKNGQPALINDVSIDPRYIRPVGDKAIGRNTRSLVCVPLIIEQKVIGALSVTHSLPNVLTEDDQDLIASFAEEAALAVYKSQLLSKLTHQRNELARREELIVGLSQITQSVLSSLDLPLVLNTIISRMGELARFDHALIYLRSERTGELQLAAVGGDGPYAASMELREGTPVLEWWNETSSSRVFKWQADNLSLLCLRLVNDGESVGCILLAHKTDIPFSKEEFDAVAKMADAATIAIIKARLFSQVTAQQQQTSALYRLMLGVNGARNRRELAQIVTTRLHKFTGAKSTALLMEDYEQSRITIWASEGEWARKDASHVSLSTQGDPFIGSTISALFEADPFDLLVIEDAPVQVKVAYGCNNCMTIPFSNSNRIYGLLVIELQDYTLMTEEAKEMVRLAVSHSTVALERAELFEATVLSMRQSSMLYTIATQVRASTDIASVVEMTVQGALNALPLQSCELYLLEGNGEQLKLHNRVIAHNTNEDNLALGPETVSLLTDPLLVDVLRSPGLIQADFGGSFLPVRRSTGQNMWHDTPSQNSPGLPERPQVLLARLMGTEEALGVVRFTARIPPEEFVHNYSTFCQTLLTHTGAALERSFLYEQLLDRKQEIEAVVLSISDGVVVIDADLNVLINNDLASKLLGLSDVQENSKALVDILHEVDLLTMLRGCIADYKPSSKEVELALDGSLRAYAATAQPILSTHEGAILGAVLTLRDVTEERENEKAKSDFLSMVSHELRTPLNSIYGFLAIILSGKAGPLSDLQTDFLSTAKQEASVLKRLINDLIDYSRLEKRLLRMEMAPVDFSSLATRVIRSASARMEQDELTLASHIPNGMMVLGDEVRLQQVFDNLLENAAKFTDPGGEVSFHCDAEEGRIKIRVIDSGCGIPQSQIDSIFERFFQADNHSSRRRQGQGLGLAICKHIVEAHGGLIWAESTTGVGTTMYVELPVLSKDGEMATQFSGDLTFAAQKQQ